MSDCKKRWWMRYLRSQIAMPKNKSYNQLWRGVLCMNMRIIHASQDGWIANWGDTGERLFAVTETTQMKPLYTVIITHGSFPLRVLCVHGAWQDFCPRECASSLLITRRGSVDTIFKPNIIDNYYSSRSE